MKKVKSTKYCGNIDCSQGLSGKARKYKSSEKICFECKSDLYIGCYKCRKQISDPSRKYCRACQGDKRVAVDDAKKGVGAVVGVGGFVFALAKNDQVRKSATAILKAVAKK